MPIGARRRLIAGLGVALVAVALVACGASTRRFGRVQQTPSPVLRTAGGPPARVAVIVMENEEFSSVISSPSTPYINALARHYALARAMFAVAHPSLPNYLALTGGSTFGIDSDCTDCNLRSTGLGAQLSAHRVSWKAYMEDLPHPCFFGSDAGDYAKKHDPFVYYGDRRTACTHVVPLRELAGDERSGLPRFVWITPNLCHDMHDCSTATGDRFLSHLVPPLLHALGPRGVLILTWDEGSSDEGCCRLAAGGHIVTVVAGPGAKLGARLSIPVDHYSTLQAIEDLLGLPRLRGAACSCTPSLAGLFKVRVLRTR
ncbi:MAG TPA: alkaline phosphatase family protein [Solirubrobacteraceae bacterium]